MASTDHAIDYVEFTVRDLAAAKRFYAAAFGWQFQFTDPSGSELGVWSAAQAAGH